MRNPNLISLLILCFLISSPSFLTISNANGHDHGHKHKHEHEKGDDEHEFNYIEGSGKGPKVWGRLKAMWKTCEAGKLQSPIDINNKSMQVSKTVGRLDRDYQPANATITNRGHDLIVEWRGNAGEITLNNTKYNLVQCHWHTPSEHTLNGQRYDMEMHIVHSDAAGHRAVIGLLYRYGRPDPFLAKLLEKLKKQGEKIDTLGEKRLDLGMFSPQKIKFGNQKYYRYTGSLTTPPCTEGVIWTIANRMRTVSKEQVKALKKGLKKGFKANSRPVQKLNRRQIYVYED